jgi:hypothetical protein
VDSPPSKVALPLFPVQVSRSDIPKEGFISSGKYEVTVPDAESLFGKMLNISLRKVYTGLVLYLG